MRPKQTEGSSIQAAASATPGGIKRSFGLGGAEAPDGGDDLGGRVTRCTIASNDGNSVENLLLEMLSTCRGNFRPVVSGGDGGRILPRLLKLTSRMMMLPDDIISDGNPPDSSDAANLAVCQEQVMPSHEQQSVPSRHDMERPPSCESPSRNWRRQLLSCSVQQLVEDAEESISTRTRQRIDMDNLFNAPCKWLLDLDKGGAHDTNAYNLFDRMPNQSEMPKEDQRTSKPVPINSTMNKEENGWTNL
uniref:Uncharacterized protein n=1 Tax=Oryza glumipatula TaxID=40148 RepID=A0A0D9YMJ9_9ORYZ